MAETTHEPRALTAALAAPVFHTQAGGLAMHVANRHIERWAPEATAHRSRPMRSLGFVDRLVAPWIETAQRSASLRMFSHVSRSGVSQREAASVSWVFPRPWYQDELDWMAAARQASHEHDDDSMLTTRGTYVPRVVSMLGDGCSIAARAPTCRAAAIQSSSSWYHGRGNTHDT